jgi:hypothetical protein
MEPSSWPAHFRNGHRHRRDWRLSPLSGNIKAAGLAGIFTDTDNGSFNYNSELAAGGTVQLDVYCSTRWRDHNSCQETLYSIEYGHDSEVIES